MPTRSVLLSSGVQTHDYPISVREAQGMDLPISTQMPKRVYDLMALYPQTTQRRPSVEHIPTPYGPPAAPGRQRRPAGRGELQG